MKEFLRIESHKSTRVDMSFCPLNVLTSQNCKMVTSTKKIWKFLFSLKFPLYSFQGQRNCDFVQDKGDSQ